MRLELESRLGRVLVRAAQFPFAIWTAALVLAGVGVLFIHSATQGGEFDGQEAKQAVAVLVLCVVAGVAAFLPRARVLRYAGAVYVVVLVALLLIPVFGVTINGARRWFAIGGMTFQPTEFMKPALILVLAHWLRFKSQAGFVDGVGVPMLLTFLPMVIIVRQPDLGSALSLLPVMFVMCYGAGARARTLLLIVFLGGVCLLAVFPFLHAYQKERIFVWLSAQSGMSSAERRAAGYHLYQSLIAVGSGGLFGGGLFEGLQNRFDFLPYRSTDFLFAVVAEETGFVGATTLVVGYLAFCMWILQAAAAIRDRFGRLLATGVAAMFATHLFIHVGVCTGLLPPTGLPLPLLSYGRSSLAGAWMSLGLVAHALVRRQRNLAGDMYL